MRGEVKDKRTYHFCPEHRDQLFDLKWSRTLPPEEWFAPGFVPDVHSWRSKWSPQSLHEVRTGVGTSGIWASPAHVTRAAMRVSRNHGDTDGPAWIRTRDQRIMSPLL